ncbi:alkaline phosphatase D family protein [Roseateles sp. LKC17W]|uniref:Alkaline phosphatase D family protein n=1 Tax=Pelomonas margarita TaxID=3299031 RepID=A0ABW7FPA6_9BURK
MGRPKQVPPAREASSRRDFFKRSGAGTVALVAAPALLPLGAQAVAAHTVFQHGVASGDPLADRVILWTRVTPAVPKPAVTVSYVIATDPALTQVVKRGSTKTNPSRDYTVKVDPTGLQPATTYYYQFSAEGAVSPVGRTKTLPVTGVDSLRMAVVSCSNHAYGYFNAYARIAARGDLDLVLHLGDYLYEYGANQYGTRRTPEPAHEMVTLADYRLRHAQYKRDADAQSLHRQHPMIAIWDDHEITNDAWKHGAQNHQPGTEGDWETRLAAGLQAYYEWMPMRPANGGNLRDNHRGFAYGDLAELLMLEERLSERSQQLTTAPHATAFGAGFATTDPGYGDTSRTLLGTTQEAWLIDRLRSTPARWKLLGQGVMFAQLKAPGSNQATDPGLYFINGDQWDGYEPARNRLYDALRGDAARPPVNNVVVLTGDIHSSWAADLHPDPYNPAQYDKATGTGSLAVEFVGTSVTSPGIDNDTSGQVAGAIRFYNPHFKYVQLTRRGYMLVDVNRDRTVAEWWYVDTVASPSNIETFATAFEVRHGENRLRPSAQTPSRATPPLLAP